MLRRASWFLIISVGRSFVVSNESIDLLLVWVVGWVWYVLFPVHWDGVPLQLQVVDACFMAPLGCLD